MPPRMLTALALTLLTALTLSACGGSGGSSTSESTAGEAVVIPAAESGAPAADPRCQHQLGGFLNSLDRLRRQLAVGLSYHPYVAQVHGVKETYEDVPVDFLSIDCLAAAGTASEKALNQYIVAANTWGECLSTVACTSTSIEPKLQHQWRIASHFLGEAESSLD